MPRGRPTDYSEKIATEICEWLVSGKSLRAWCEQEAKPNRSTVMRWLGKAPMVKIISKQTLEVEVQRAGFVDVSTPDVGARPTIAFIVAAKPR